MLSMVEGFAQVRHQTLCGPISRGEPLHRFAVPLPVPGRN